MRPIRSSGIAYSYTQSKQAVQLSKPIDNKRRRGQAQITSTSCRCCCSGILFPRRLSCKRATASTVPRYQDSEKRSPFLSDRARRQLESHRDMRPSAKRTITPLRLSGYHSFLGAGSWRLPVSSRPGSPEGPTLHTAQRMGGSCGRVSPPSSA